MARRWVYRASQFFTALLGRVSNAEMQEARHILGPALYTIFASMPGQYRRHGLTVLYRVRQAGCNDNVVGRAALLHDSGKYDPRTGRYVTIAHRVTIVLLEATPIGRNVLKRLAEVGESEGGRLRGLILYPFYLNEYHPSLGAQLAAQHGASDELTQLIANHQRRPARSRQLAVLQAADDSS